MSASRLLRVLQIGLGLKSEDLGWAGVGGTSGVVWI